jgi:hypothetical protein
MEGAWLWTLASLQWLAFLLLLASKLLLRPVAAGIAVAGVFTRC